MSDMSKVDQAQFRQLLDGGKTPDEAAQILLQSRRAMAEACERLLEKLDTQEGTAALQQMLDDLDAVKAIGDVVESETTRPEAR
jgi:hypothetical protein